MAIFQVDCFDAVNGKIVPIFYDTKNSTLKFTNGENVINGEYDKSLGYYLYSNSPVKSHHVKHLRIIIGTRCNYKCSYCSQSFNEKDNVETTIEDVDIFLSRLDEWLVGEPQRIELWGGEPLVYIKYLKKLIPSLRDKFKNAQITTITNGSLLTDEIVDFLLKYKIIFSVSHDAYGQAIRGKDILDDPKILKIIDRASYELDKIDSPIRSFSFNAVYSKAAYDPIKMREFFVKKLGRDISMSADPVLAVGRASVDKETLLNDKELCEFSENVALAALLDENLSAYNLRNYRIGFVNSIINGKNINNIGCKCNVPYGDSLVVDIKGNVYTCQNFITNSDIKGSVYDFDNINIDNLYTLNDRVSCQTCPYVHMCKCGCPASKGNSFAETCRIKFAYFSGIFVSSIFRASDLIPLKIIAKEPIKFPVSQLIETNSGKYIDINTVDLPRIDFKRCEKYIEEKSHERLLGIDGIVKKTHSPET
jgi:uncharacterized protein